MIIDTFLYFNEEELIELRLDYLSEIVDYFVIVEANLTHQGKEKDWNFEKLLSSKFTKYKEKIIYQKKIINLEMVDNEIGWGGKTNGEKSWKIENFHRNSIKEYLSKFDDNDIILLSDLDEIPSKDKIVFLKNCNLEKIHPVAFEQKLFHLNCNYITLEKWFGTIAILKKMLDKHSPQYLRSNIDKMSIFMNAGWTFSSFGGVKRVKEKLESFAHAEYNNSEYKNDVHISECINLGIDLFKRNSKRKRIDKSFFPEEILRLLKNNEEFYFGGL